jgi:hypothetical protein
MTSEYLVLFVKSYLFTITVETAVLLVALSRRHPLWVRLFSGVWLTMCTYPVVWFVIPHLFDPTGARTLYLWTAETFAPVAECGLFWAAFGKKELLGTRSMWQDLAAITAANLASFGLGEWLYWNGWLFPGAGA